MACVLGPCCTSSTSGNALLTSTPCPSKSMASNSTTAGSPKSWVPRDSQVFPAHKPKPLGVPRPEGHSPPRGIRGEADSTAWRRAAEGREARPLGTLPGRTRKGGTNSSLHKLYWGRSAWGQMSQLPLLTVRMTRREVSISS